MKGNIFIENQSGLYYGSGEWNIKIVIDCKSVDELEEIISKLKEIIKTLGEGRDK